MILRAVQILSLIGILIYSQSCIAVSAISIASGNGTKKVHANRIAWQNRWFKELATANNRKFNGYWELAYTRLVGKQAFNFYTSKRLDIVTGAAVLRIHKEVLMLPLYVDLGIGVSYLSKQDIASRDLGSHYLFEDRIGIGLLFGRRGQVEIGYRAVHYSNAYLTKKNHGLNLHLLVIGYWLH